MLVMSVSVSCSTHTWTVTLFDAMGSHDVQDTSGFTRQKAWSNRGTKRFQFDTVAPFIADFHTHTLYMQWRPSLLGWRSSLVVTRSY